MTSALHLRLRSPLVARWCACVAPLALVMACTKAPARVDLTDPAKARASAPMDLSQLGQSTFEFGVDLWRTLARDRDWATRNIVISPYSLSEAFGMVYAGARGETAQEIAQTFHYGVTDARLHAGFDALRRELAEIGATHAPAGRAPVEVLIANSLWAQDGFAIAPSYRDLVEERYSGTVRNVNFARASEQARGEINSWVKERTRGLVSELFPNGTLASSTSLVLVDTVYLRGTWEEPFPRSATRPGPFEKLDGRSVEMPFMRRVLNAGYVETTDYQAVELRYVGGRLSLFLILPARGKFAETQERLNSTLLRSLAAELPRARRQVDFSMPKFQLSLPLSLGGPLVNLGIKHAFGVSADFTGMVASGHPPLFIEQVRHHVHFAVDEEQTEAGAASGVVMSYSAAVEKTAVHLDRPFFLGIHDKKTNVLLFWGRVVDPSAGD